MNADRSSVEQASGSPGALLHSRLTRRVIGCFYDVFNELGSGFLEAVYASALHITLSDNGLIVELEVSLDVLFRGRVVGQYRADLLVDRRLIVEVKAVPRLLRAHDAQLINYLRATGVRVGLLMNFGPSPEFRRFVLSRREERSAFIRGNPRLDQHRQEEHPHSRGP